MTRIVIPLLFLTRPLPAQRECAPCHPTQVAAHLQTRHARAARPVQQTEFFRKLPDGPIGEARGGFLLSYAAEGRAVRVTAERGNEKASALIDWVLGAGDQGETPIAESGGVLLEHRISYYAKPGKFDLTLGHQPGASASARAALGIPQAPKVAEACLGCHSQLSMDGKVASPGLACSHCHAGSAEHARAASAPIVNPAKLEAAAAVRLCAGCHRLTAPGRHDDPLNIRFQPLRLVKSLCYQAGAMSCATCHEAHRDTVRHDPGYYVAKCTGCHASPHRNGNCLPCHMASSSPAPYLTFTDHYIRKNAGSVAAGFVP
jgi:hypothetical protein